MTLIPALMARWMPQPVAERTLAASGPTLARTGYRPDTRSRPLAIMLGAGGPALLLIAYSITPQIIPKIEERGPMVITSVPVPPPPPPPTPQTETRELPDSRITAPAPPFTPPVATDVDAAPPQPVPPPPLPPGPSVDPLPPRADPAPPTPRTPPRLDERYASAFQPDYPLPELRKEVEGVAKVRVLVGVDGRVKAVEDAGSTSPGFFTEAKRRALSKWRLHPATEGGKPVEGWFTVTVRFELKNV